MELFVYNVGTDCLLNKQMYAIYKTDLNGQNKQGITSILGKILCISYLGINTAFIICFGLFLTFIF